MSSILRHKTQRATACYEPHKIKFMSSTCPDAQRPRDLLPTYHVQALALLVNVTVVKLNLLKRPTTLNQAQSNQTTPKVVIFHIACLCLCYKVIVFLVPHDGHGMALDERGTFETGRVPRCGGAADEWCRSEYWSSGGSQRESLGVCNYDQYPSVIRFINHVDTSDDTT